MRPELNLSQKVGEEPFLPLLPRDRRRRPIISPRRLSPAAAPASSPLDAQLMEMTGRDWALRQAALELRPQVGLVDGDFQLLVMALRSARLGHRKMSEARDFVVETFASGDWAWPDYDAWAARFRARGIWPLSWPWGELSTRLAEGLEGNEGRVLEAMGVPGIRRLLAAAGALPHPRPRGRGAWILAAVEAAKHSQAVREALRPWWVRACGQAAAGARAERAALLLDTFNAMAARAAAAVCREESVLQVLPASEIWSGELSAKAGDQLPPFFPGDASAVVVDWRGWTLPLVPGKR